MSDTAPSNQTPASRVTGLRHAGRAVSQAVLLVIMITISPIAVADETDEQALREFQIWLEEHDIPASTEGWYQQQHGEHLEEARANAKRMRAVLTLPLPEQEILDSVLLFSTFDNAPGPLQRIHPDMRDNMARFLKADRAFFEQFAQFDAQSRYAFDYDLKLPMDDPLLGAVRRGARRHQLRAIHAQAVNDPVAAVEALQAIVTCSETLRYEPYVISLLVRSSVEWAFFDHTSVVLSRMTLEPEKLEELIRSLEQVHDDDALLRAFASELALGVRALAEPENDYSDTLTPRGVQELMIFYPRMARAANLQALVNLVIEHDEQIEQREMSDVERRITHLLTPFARAWQIRESMRCSAIAAMHVERYRLTHNDWPADLAEVEQALGVTLPVDPFTGQSLRYRATDTGVMVYSVGPSGIDHGGFSRQDWDKSDAPADPDDIIFRLYDAERRNSLPAVKPESAESLDWDNLSEEQILESEG